MFKAPLNLKKSRILLSNDDGFGAPGLKRLEKITKAMGAEVWIVAPEAEQSGAGHSLTLRRPLRIRKVAARRFAVDGTPTDCVLLAVNRIMRDCRPDLVLSGINRGSNLGEDMTYSGTIAAAMEATLLGIPAIALSQRVADMAASASKRAEFSSSDGYAAEVIREVTGAGWSKDVFINVNFPAVPKSQVKGIEITREGRRKVGDEILEGRDPRDDEYFWIGNQKISTIYPDGTDLAAIHAGKISVTPLSMDLTHKPTMRKLADLFGGAKKKK
ncbi:MAG: 5'/3'-nucleotidase SurE [Rhodospirillales bacterium]|nr:5'/3'-nucleotidase SurE [Rhodospirillales bacterium]